MTIMRFIIKNYCFIDLLPLNIVDIDMEYMLGKGAFGVVMKGKWNTGDVLYRKRINIAIKIIYTENDNIVVREVTSEPSI